MGDFKATKNHLTYFFCDNVGRPLLVRPTLIHYQYHSSPLLVDVRQKQSGRYNSTTPPHQRYLISSSSFHLSSADHKGNQSPAELRPVVHHRYLASIPARRDLIDPRPRSAEHTVKRPPTSRTLEL